MPARRDALDAASALGVIDVVVIGAGINGAATFRDLSLQGVRCLLIDREDFGAGASSASTRMVHGGLRYLENGEIRLVAEATRERNRLLRNAPHAVAPIPISIPFFSFSSGIVPSVRRCLGLSGRLVTRGLLMAELGLWLYDWLGRHDRIMPRHVTRIGHAARSRFPMLHGAVRGVATYYDATVHQAERIALELVADGLAANPAGVALNHCELDGYDGNCLLLRDLLGGRTLRVRPRVVVNAAGAWIDTVNARVGPAAPLIGGTKGSHLVIEHAGLHAALAGHGFIFDDGRGRVCVVYPFADMVILGSTDIPIADPDEARCDDAETAYLLAAIRVVFPTVEVSREHVRYRFCGVRPLPRSGAATPGAVSRDHSLARSGASPARPFPVLSLVGGKWTTFRAFAEQASDAALAELRVPRRMSTERLAIGGGRDYPATQATRDAWSARLAMETGLPVPRVAMLLARYGTRAWAVATRCAAAGDAALSDAPDYSEHEIRFLIGQEMAVTLGDLIYRRTTLAIEGRLTLRLLQRLSGLLAEQAGIGERRAAADLSRTLARLHRENGVALDEPAPLLVTTIHERNDVAS